MDDIRPYVHPTLVELPVQWILDDAAVVSVAPSGHTS